ncbi:unnamed protein product [Blepharisma stoltei]|uniref:Uncharacterized protein n=1 Tax=Blepharisma stoltei TaxID=1481888 RepID=A0AAU9KFV9_9CILI|nr:unnamed protein product [Blepharisma stoltei]
MGQKASTDSEIQKKYILPSPGTMGAGSKAFGYVIIYTDNKIHQLQVTPSLSVKSAKAFIDPKNKKNLKLVLENTELDNSQKIKDLNIGPNTVIKAIYHKKKSIKYDSTCVNSENPSPFLSVVSSNTNFSRLYEIDMRKYEVGDAGVLVNKIKGTNLEKGINKMKKKLSLKHRVQFS